MKEKISKSAQSTRLHGSKFSQILKTGCNLILLKGSLGSGKTEWVRGFAKNYFKGKSVFVSSPSYSVVNIYGSSRKKIYHVDLYRLKSLDDLESVGFWDFLKGNNVVIVEWGDSLPPLFPDSVAVFEVQFEIRSKNERLINAKEI
jgi:tRNA threonylcarbamoyladenosine biosynthesis protein TsaE